MVRYPYDGAIYAVCKCGYERSAFINYLFNEQGEFKRNENGELVFRREPDNLTNYCPNEELFNGRNDGNDVVDGMQSGK
jgi:hypothetical protein